MAKKNKVVLVKLTSTAGTGQYFVKKRDSKSQKKLEFNKYDKVIRKHVMFKEEKMK